MSLTCFGRRFTLDWKMLILASVSISLFIKLGFWQLSRAIETKELLLKHASFSHAKPLPWNLNMLAPKQYQRINLTGHYLPKIFLLDNQHYQHQFGYHILSPFALDANHIVLIDRGWIQKERLLKQPSNWYGPSSLMHITGEVYYPSKNNWLLGDGYEKIAENLTIVELIDTQLIAGFLHKTSPLFIIRLDINEPSGFVREWPIVALTPARHYGYAFQWYALALTSLILFILFGIVTE